MILPMTISSGEQPTVQNQGGGDRYTSVGGGHPPYKISDCLTLSTGVNPSGSENYVIRGPYFLSQVPHNSNPVLSLGWELTKVSPHQGPRPPDVLSLQYYQDSNSCDWSALLNNRVLGQCSPTPILHKQRAGSGISNVVDGQQFSHCLLC